MIAHVNGVDLFYEKTGQGRPLVMVHGNGEDHTIFDEAVEVLRERFTCYCVDSRSHGQSTEAGELHYEDMAEDMIAFMEELDLRNVAFYGFSDGGIVGLLTAPRCDRITTLVVSGANLSHKGGKKYLTYALKVLYLFKKDPKIQLMLQEPNIPEEYVRKITIPTLVLAGSKDLILEQETRRIAAAIPGAELRILDGEGHGSYIVHKNTIAKILLDYLSEETKKPEEEIEA